MVTGSDKVGSGNHDFGAKVVGRRFILKTDNIGAASERVSTYYEDYGSCSLIIRGKC